MYSWQRSEQFTHKLKPGTIVVLNPAWIGFEYLQREYSSHFPRKINEHNTIDGIVTFHSGPEFARQCVMPIGEAYMS